MKTALLLASLLCLPVAGHAACAPTDFVIKDFKTSVSGVGGTQRVTLAGELVNNCTDPSAAQIRIDAKDADGKVVQSKEGWPAGTTNIAPGLDRQVRSGPALPLPVRHGDLHRQRDCRARLVKHAAAPKPKGPARGLFC